MNNNTQNNNKGWVKNDGTNPKANTPQGGGDDTSKSKDTPDDKKMK